MPTKTVNPEVISYYDQALLYYKSKQFDKSIQSCTKAIELDPNFFDAYIDRGLACYEKGNLDQAISDFNKAIEINPSSARAFYNRGFVSLKRGDFEQTILDSSKAIDLAPYHVDSYENRAEAYFYIKEYDKSWNDLRSFKSLNGQIKPNFLEKLKISTGKSESELNFNFHPIHTKIVLNNICYWLSRFLFVLATAFFILEYFFGIAENIASYLFTLTFATYILSQKTLGRKLPIHEKAFCYFAIYFLFGLILADLIVNTNLKLIWFLPIYFLMSFGVIVLQTFYYIRQIKPNNRLNKLLVWLSALVWGLMAVCMAIKFLSTI